MKIWRSLCVTFLAVIILCSAFICTYAEEKATICGVSASVGSTVTYTFSVSDSQQKIAGAHLEFYYDRDCLTLESVTDHMKNSTINEDTYQTGRILIVNALVNGSSGLNCSSKKDLVSISFIVNAAMESDITYYIPYLYDADLENLNEYTFSADISIDDEVIFEGQTPVLEDVSLRDDVTDVGDFVNTPNGKPESEPVPQKPSYDDTQNRTTAPESGHEFTTLTEETEPLDDKDKDRDEDKDEDKDDEAIFSGNIILIVLLSALVVLLLVGISILAVYIIRKNKK